MGCIQSRPLLARIEEGIFFLGSIYSTIVSYVSHFLNRFYNLLLSPLFHLDGNVPSRLCDDRGVCYRPKDRLMQKRKTDERIRRAEFAAKGLDPKLALRPKESRNASTTDLVSGEKAAPTLSPTPSPPLWVMGNVAPQERKPRPVSTEKPRKISGHAAPHPFEDQSAAAKRKRRQSAPVQALDGARRKYHYEVLATSEKEPRARNLSNTVAADPGLMDGSFATAADRLKSHHRRSLQVVEEKSGARKQQHGRQSPAGRAAGVGPAAAAPTDTDAAGIWQAPPSRSSFSSPLRTSTDVASTGGASPYGNNTTPRGSIADLASAAAKSRNTKDRKAWRGEISKVAKTRVAPSPAAGAVAAGGVGATMGRFGGSPLAGELASAHTSPDLQGFHAPHRAQTFA